MTTKKFKNSIVWPTFSRFIRLRDCLRTTNSLSYGYCITCKGLFLFSELEAGHYIPGRHSANLFYERGCHAQCGYCNQCLDGNRERYAEALVQLYGQEILQELEENNRQIKKFTRLELEMLLNHYRVEIRRMEDDFH